MGDICRHLRLLAGESTLAARDTLFTHVARTAIPIEFGAIFRRSPRTIQWQAGKRASRLLTVTLDLTRRHCCESADLHEVRAIRHNQRLRDGHSIGDIAAALIVRFLA